MKPQLPAPSRRYMMVAPPLILALVGTLGAVAGQPWLFPSLGPTAFLLAVSPEEPAARLWNTLVGHAIGASAGFAALFLCAAENAPAALAAETTPVSRIIATVVAVGLTVALQLKLNAKHPPAAATTMLITLGGLKPEWRSVFALAIGVGLVAGLGRGAWALLRHRA